MAFSKSRSIKLEKGLYLIEQSGRATYSARAFHAGKLHYTPCETTDYGAAEKVAVRWFRGLRAAREGRETMTAAAAEFLGSVADAGKRANHAERWSAIREFFQPTIGDSGTFVAEVDSPALMQFVAWKRKHSARISASTIKKDLVTVRQILKYAVLRGKLATMPEFPGVQQVGRIDANPQPWLTPDEWKQLLIVANERIDEASNVRTRAQRSELRDWMLFMHATGLRVDEARGLRVRDCTEKVATTGDWHSIPAILAPPDYQQSRGVRRETIDSRRVSKREAEMRVRLPYVEVRLRLSKTGPRICQSRAYADAILRRLVKGKAATDPLFTEHHRDAFRELLTAADLRVNDHGHPRNAKCLRPTAISHWLLDRPTIPLSWLASNVGTSITMLQQFYIKRLGLALDGSAWL